MLGKNKENCMVKNVKILITLFVFVIAVSCKQSNEYSGYAILEFYKVYQHGKVNINIYLLPKYNERFSLNENINQMKEMECLILVMDEDEFKNFSKGLNFFSDDEFLAKVKVRFLEDYKKTKSEYYLLQRPKKNLPTDCYMLFEDFESFEIINLEKLNEKWCF